MRRTRKRSTPKRSTPKRRAPKRSTRKRWTHKRKLALTDFHRCHPGLKSSQQTCLPDSVYSQLQSKQHVSTKDALFRQYDCKPGEEHCLLDRAPLDDTIKKDLRKQYLRPRRPKAWNEDPDMWLDNFNIMHVMKQYQVAYPWFKFIGVFPIDFSAPDPYTKTEKPKCLYNELCDLNLTSEYEEGTRGIGVIFNLDPHFKGGSHWVGLYINLKDIKAPKISYFDSYGYKTPALIARLMRSFTLQIPTCTLAYNARRFQYGNSECGMFSMYFIVCMMNDIPFDEFCKDAVNDGMMLELRQILFAK